MKKFLPQKGFTLIELLVAIAIIAILSTMGIVYFANSQKNARDARRRSDVDAIANALETNKTPGQNTYNPLAANQFSSGAVPVDSGNNLSAYCISYDTAGGATPPSVPTGWTNATDCPANPLAAGTRTAYTAIPNSGGTPPSTAASWTVCALLENGGTTTQYCRTSTQQ